MEKVKVFYDRKGNSLTVWLDDPKKEFICDEIENDIVLMRDRRGRVIGFEQLNYLRKKQKVKRPVPVEVQML
jgi:uncharacterized protein YuzE